MKPITEDVVFSLMEDLEERERMVRPKTKEQTSKLSRLLRPVGGAGIISLDAAREARRRVSGVFCYVARH